MRRATAIGFHLQAYDEVFDERCVELKAFKEELLQDFDHDVIFDNHYAT